MTPSPLPQDVILSGLKCNLNVAKDIEWQWHCSDEVVILNRLEVKLYS